MPDEKTFPVDYQERVYAGVLGKIIGVYLGRPVENWSYADITAQFGEIKAFVHQSRNLPLVVTDDDVSGTFTFYRSLEDYQYPAEIQPRQIGQTWLNYIIENRAFLWWGGFFHSTEHTAYLRLKEGIPAPESGSLRLNGSVIANQIGAQIYIDSWAMLCPGDPERAAELARRSASVSHDDEAIYAAQLIAAMEAQAFVETDIPTLIDTGLRCIPRDSIIARLVNDLREWHGKDADWKITRERIVSEYGYKKYVGGCHVVPNHALIHLGLLYGQGDFRKSLSICVTSGWDTDCNAGNLGCLLAIRGGLESIPADFRDPVNDRMLIASADGGGCISDAVLQAGKIVETSQQLHGLEYIHPKDGARFHFSLPGSTQGFALQSDLQDFVGNAAVSLCNATLPGQPTRGLRIDINKLGAEQKICIATPTFAQPDELNMSGYVLCASPTLYPGQHIAARVMADPLNPEAVQAGLILRYVDHDDRPALLIGPQISLNPGEAQVLTWRVPPINGGPIFAIGFSFLNHSYAGNALSGSVYVEYLRWDGSPEVTFTRPAGSHLPHPGPMIFRSMWADGMDIWEPWYQQAFRVIQNKGRGLISTGTREWTDYVVSAQITVAMCESGGLAARVQGMQRFYALEFSPNATIQLVKVLDGEQVLQQAAFAWEIWRPYELKLAVKGNLLRGWVNETLLFEVTDVDAPLLCGGVGITANRGHLAAPAVKVTPL